MRRVVAIVALLCMLVAGSGVAVAVWLSGDGSGGTGGESEGPAALAPTPAEPEPGSKKPPSKALKRFYGQGIVWAHCEGSEALECATVTVPLDYGDPRGSTIDLALVKDPAADPDARQGTLVVNPGGPGVPGTSMAAQAPLYFGDAVLDHYDVVGFDPRGVGDSSPVDCLPDDEMDAYVASDPTPDTAAERAEFLRWVDMFGAGCADLSGAVAAHVSTVEAARDMDVIRAALGETTLDYYGGSYGTKLGATYAELFAANVGRFVLDAGVDPSTDKRTDALEQAGGFETALRSFVANCVESTESCFLGETVDEGVARIQEFLAEVDEQPLPTSLDRELTSGSAYYGVAFPLYSRDAWILLSQGLQQAFDGDGSTLLRLSDLYTGRRADGGYTDNRIEALPTINCLDDPSAITPGQVPAALRDFAVASPTFGDGFAWGLRGCSGFEARAAEKPPVVRAEGAAPIVVVGTTRDPATPIEWSESLADQLESGVLVRRDGDGHGGYNAGNECVDAAVEGYLVDGTVPEDGLTC